MRDAVRRVFGGGWKVAYDPKRYPYYFGTRPATFEESDCDKLTEALGVLSDDGLLSRLDTREWVRQLWTESVAKEQRQPGQQEGEPSSTEGQGFPPVQAVLTTSSVGGEAPPASSASAAAAAQSEVSGSTDEGSPPAPGATAGAQQEGEPGGTAPMGSGRTAGGDSIPVPRVPGSPGLLNLRTNRTPEEASENLLTHKLREAMLTSDPTKIKRILESMLLCSSHPVHQSILDVQAHLAVAARDADAEGRAAACNAVQFEAKNDFGAAGPFRAEWFDCFKSTVMYGRDMGNQWTNVSMVTCKVEGSRKSLLALYVVRRLLPETAREPARQGARSFKTHPERIVGNEMVCVIGGKSVVSLLVNGLKDFCLVLLADAQQRIEIVGLPLKKPVDARTLLCGAFSYESFGKFAKTESVTEHPHGRNISDDDLKRLAHAREKAENLWCEHGTHSTLFPFCPLPFLLPSSQVRRTAGHGRDNSNGRTTRRSARGARRPEAEGNAR